MLQAGTYESRFLVRLRLKASAANGAKPKPIDGDGAMLVLLKEFKGVDVPQAGAEVLLDFPVHALTLLMA